MWEIVRDNPEKPWSWFGLSRNPNIMWKIVRDNPEKPWNWFFLSKNPNITWEIVRDNPEKPWSWVGLSKNPNITWEIVRDNPDRPWKYSALFMKKLDYVMRCDAVTKIARWYKNLYYEPDNFCRTRRFDDMKDRFYTSFPTT